MTHIRRQIAAPATRDSRRRAQRFCGLEDLMANSAPSGTDDYNTKIIEEFRANGGRVGGPWADITLILVHHIGAKSGIDRVSPLAYSLQGDSRFAIWAANGGSPIHPNWYYNLKAKPRIKAEVGTRTFTVLAEELDDTARAELWPKLVAQYPQLGDAQAKTTRQIPVFMLTRQD
jgi:deazaflavin-dependent oxidoreductase (nitroreductase family)